MPLYQYIALNQQGGVATGEATATSAEDLRRELDRQGLLVRKIRKKGFHFGFRSSARVAPDAFLLFNQEFLALLRAGLTIPEALQLVADRPDSPILSRVIPQVARGVQQGESLSQACAQHTETFEGPYLAALRTGEKSGELPRSLEKYQTYLRQRVAIQRKVSQALAYPMFLLITMAVILLVLFVFVLPRFVSLYADFGAQLPLPTRILITVVDYLPYYFPVLIGLGVFAWWSWRRVGATPAGQEWAERLKQRIPLFGQIYRDAATTQIAHTLASLLGGGTPLVEALRISAESLASPARARRLAQVARQVSEGKGLAVSLHACALLPDSAVRLVQVGEASGGLDRMLEEIAAFHEERLAFRLARIMALIEPILMLLMGVLIGGIIIVMYLPIFYIVDVIK